MNIPLRSCCFFLIIPLSLVSLIGCNNTANHSQIKPITSADSDSISTAQYMPKCNEQIDVYAEFLAGIDSILYSQNEIYKRYNESVEQAYADFYSSKISLVSEWSQENIKSTNKRVFYPFSGPDIIYAYSLFPKASEYNLFGLEPVGEIPNWSESERDSMLMNLNSLQNALSDQMRFSFFVTSHMSEDLGKQKVDGVLPILLFYIKRLGLKIHDVQCIEIEPDGSLAPKTDGISMGLQIKCFKEGETNLQTVNYFSVDISNSGYNKCPGLDSLILALKDSETLIKSASYCLHEEKYSHIRSQIIDVSHLIVQDDTGVPFKYLNKPEWSNRFFGTYTSPINVFKQFYQGDYYDAFKKSSVPITFRFGYSNPSNILIATRN
jgi:hypothetical protein